MHPCSRPLVFLLSLTLLAGTFSAAWAQTNTCADIPEEWQGIWESTMTLQDCESGFVLSTQNFSDTICPGNCFDTGDENLECDLIIEGSTVTFSCTGSVPAGPGCLGDVEVELVYTLDGTSLTGGGTQTILYSGDCPPELQDQCMELEYSATRTSGSEVCSVPVSRLNWSVLKGSFH